MRIGVRITVTKEIDLSPHACIQPGETGEITRIDPDGEIWITLDKYHHGLGEWRNAIWINTYTQEVAASIRVVELTEAA